MKKTHERIDSKGHKEVWEWDETPELKAFIKQQTVAQLSMPPTRPK